MARLSKSRRTAGSAASAEGRGAVPGESGAAQVRPAKRFASCFALIFVLLTSSIAWANDQVVVADFSLGSDARGVPEAWQLAEKRGQASLSIAKMDGLNALVLSSADTSFSIQRRVKVDLEQYPSAAELQQTPNWRFGAQFPRFRASLRGIGVRLIGRWSEPIFPVFLF